MLQRYLLETLKYRQKGDPKQNLERAIFHYQNAREVHTLQAFPLECLKASTNLGNLYFEEKRWDEAIACYELATKAVEVSRSVAISDQRRQEILAESIPVFNNIIESHIELGQLQQALTYAEQSKSRNLTELLASRELYPKGDIDPETLTVLKRLRRQIPSLDRQLHMLEADPDEEELLQQQRRSQTKTALKKARNELDEVLKKIQSIDPTFTLTQSVSSITFTEIQALIDEDTAIIEWHMLDQITLAFIITKNQIQPILYSIESGKLLDAISSYFEFFVETEAFTNNVAVKKLLSTKWQALREGLELDQIFSLLQPRNLKKLILVPHRFLHFLPLHALPLTDGRCLLDHFEAGVSYVPSCQLLQVLQRNQKPSLERLFAVKNPTQDLIFSEFEVEAIRDYFTDTDILERQQASETALRQHPNLENMNCLHFSCHGVFDFNSPLQSALLLNNDLDKNSDSRLTLAEIFELDLLNCSLVTLSACETGIVDFTQLTDEYISLPSGFIYAGSSAVVSSLWRVSDLATSLLMTKLYQNLKQDSLHVAVALNSAQNWMRTLTPEKGQAFIDSILPAVERMFANKPAILKRAYLNNLAVITKPDCPFTHPYYWAGFTVVGI